jgi:hypothetical protein
MPNKRQKSPQLTNIIHWQNLTVGGVRGVINQHVERPYLVGIDKAGKWMLYYFDDADQAQLVKRGKAKNVKQAKVKASQIALAKIPELCAYTKRLEQENTLELQPQPISGARRTYRIYAVTTTLILGIVWGFYEMIIRNWRPWASAAIVLVLGLMAADWFLKTASDRNKRREVLVKAVQPQQVVQRVPVRR